MCPPVAGAAPSANEDKGLEVPPSKDDDPDGHKLLGSPDPLEKAAKLLTPLSTLAADNIDVWIAIYDVAIRRSMYRLSYVYTYPSAHGTTPARKTVASRQSTHSRSVLESRAS